MLKRKTVGIGVGVVVLVVLGFSQMYAQSGLTLEGLSNRITTLNQRISTLSNTKASKNEMAALENRVATLEAKLGDTDVIATATRRRPTLTPIPHLPTSTPTRLRPTSTPTRVRPTATPTHAKPYIRIASRNMNVRSGPGTNYAVIGYAITGQEYDITGKNADGSWWRIDFDGDDAWIYAPYVTAVYADRIRSVPTPIPPRPTRQPTATPRPQVSSEEETYLYAAALVFFDQESMGKLDEWTKRSRSQQAEAIELSAGLLYQLSRWCNLSTEEVADLIGDQGKVIDDSGFTARKGLPSRQLLMFFTVQFAEENPLRVVPCAELFEIGAQSMIDSE